MNCAQVKEQLVDFLYEELPPNLRAAFVEHLHGCPGCSVEVASHQKALGQARAALAGPLLQEPPARVHAAVLAAAQAAAAATKRDAQRQGERAPRAGGGGAIRESPLRPPEPEDEPGFFTRFWRTPWLLPAFGAVSVATAVFLVKVLKNPEVLPGQRLRPIDELTAPPTPAAPTGARAKVVAAPAEPAAPVAEASAPQPSLGGIDGLAPAAGRKARAVAAKAPGKTEAAARTGARAPASSGSGRFAEPPPPRTPPKDSRFIDDLLGEVGSARKPAAAPAEAAPEVTERQGPSRGDDGLADYGRPPVAAPTAAPAPAQPPMPAAAPTRAVAPTAKSVHRQKVEAEMAPANYPAKSAEEQPAKDRVPAAKGGPSLDESIKKADRLFAAQDWTAAAEAYRDLLRRFPSHKDAPKWRDRISQSLVADESRRRANEAKAGKAAKAKSSSEVLNGRK